ncbi:hypothetical protein [Clostridium niameyense]|uniref:hypothetical protein n=1 Tax=Clostridium niameyense TaxID=1622073 RepID=UPI00067E9F75|nr:hypothetical protein [Clostridium niameyense]
MPNEKPTLVKVPKVKYFCIKGKGNLNDEDFSNRIDVLCSPTCAVRMMPKNGFTSDRYFDCVLLDGN